MRVRIVVISLLLSVASLADATSDSASISVTATIESFLQVNTITNDPKDPTDDEVVWNSNDSDGMVVLVYTCPDGEEYAVPLPEREVRYAMRDYTFTQEQLAQMVDHPQPDQPVLVQRTQDRIRSFEQYGPERGVADFFFAFLLGAPYQGI